MATSPDYLRLATSSTRALADAALDSLREAVVVVDARHKNLPVVLANAAARRCLSPIDQTGVIESPLHRLLTAASSTTVGAAIASLTDSQAAIARVLEWRRAEGEISVMTEIKPLVMAPEQRLVMLTFAATPEPGSNAAAHHLTERRSGGDSQGGGDRRLLALTEHARDIITVTGKDGKVLFVSAGVTNSLGYTAEERRSNNLFEHVHPDDQVALRFQYQRLVAGEIRAFAHEFRYQHKDGSYRWLESSFTSALDNPLIGGVVINSRDFTERKQAESQLAQREELFRLAADAVNGIICEWDVASGHVRRSRGVLEVLGLEAEDVDPSTDAWSVRVHPRDYEAARKALNLALLNGRGWTVTYRVRDVRGRYRSVIERGLIQRNASGDPVRAICCCVDVSEINRVTDLLADTQRTAKMGGWEYSYATRELTWTDEMYRIFEADRKEFAVSWHSMLAQYTPESRRRFHAACRRSEAVGGQLDLELEITTLKDERIWVRMIGHTEMLDGRPFRAFGSVQNVQAQKLAQIALENSTGWLKLSMNMANMHAWRWDLMQDAFEFAVVEGRDAHLPRVFAGMKRLMSRVHPADRHAVNRAIDDAFKFQAEVQREFRLRSRSGRYHWYAAIARPFFDGKNLPCGLVGVVQDITERRDSEVRLRRSEELLRATTANAADTLVLVDTGLRVRFINKSVGGMRIEEIIGCGIEVLLPDEARESVTDKLRHILDTGATATYEFESSADDQVRYFENRAVLVRDDGIGTGISISIRDITERKRLEQEILDISGRERQSIGRDLHDGLGQELTGVALMLRGLSSRLQQSCPEAMDSVDEIVGLVNRSIENARSLARGLLPVRSETGGLVFALRELASRSRDLYGLEVSCRAEVWPELRLSETDASHLYRIAQEALTNSARHGHATRVDIFLLVTRSTFLLCINDNGEGFLPPTSPYSGMGLKIMQYRAGIIGASFEIALNEPRGTVVRVAGEQPLATVSTDGARQSRSEK
jgi:two-component system, NarL family, sensor histidine kinase UhpB